MNTVFHLFSLLPALLPRMFSGAPLHAGYYAKYWSFGGGQEKVPALMEGEKQASIDECYEKKIKNKIWW